MVDVADPDLRLDTGVLDSAAYCKQALVDGPEMPAVATLEWLVDEVVTAVTSGGKVLVACAGGRNRSGLVRLAGCSGAQALSLIQSRRDNALNNLTFARHLAALPARDS